MNELQTNKKTISSREVTVLMGEQKHTNMLRKIDGINNILLNSNLSPANYWKESSYKDSTGRTLREYQVTKKGCELIAHKTEGEKGVLFTIKYMERFEELEKAVKDSYMISDPVERARRWIQEQEEKKLILEQNEQMKPKAIFADAVASSKTSILVGELAKLIKQNGHEIGQKRLFTWLRENGYLIRRNGTDWNMPTQRSMEKGLFEIKETSVTHADGHITVNKTPKVTGVGQQYFINKFLSNKGD